MRKVMLLMQLANLLLIGVSSEDTLCQYSGRQWQNNILDYNDVLEYETIHPYKDWMVCSGAYKLGSNCAGAVVSCEEFSTVASKGCRWGDYMSIIEKDTGSYKRFCRNIGPSNYKPKGDFKLRFVSNGRKTAYGVSCQITCPEPIVPPVDCTLSEWGPWTSCSQTCGYGTQTRQRSKVTIEANGGTCLEKLDDSQDCNEQACPPECESGWTKFDGTGKCYKYIDMDPNVYPSALTACTNEGANMISITSQEEFDFFKGMVAPKAMSIWLGAEHRGSNTYSWKDGSQWSYENWADGEPNYEHCVIYDYQREKFYSKDCLDGKYLAFCKKDPQ